MEFIKPLLGPLRAPFLLLTPACVLAGMGAAAWRSGRLDPLQVALAMAGAVLAHIAVNSLNEFHDFKSGLDSRTKRTPFSGGSGTLQEHPELAGWALAAGLGSAAVVAAIGLFFVRERGPLLLLPGLAGLAVILAYTPLLTKNPLACLLAPGLGFGTCMVMGTEYALSGCFSWTGFSASLVPFFLVSDLLLLNQFPDVKADRKAGRSHLLIVHGMKAGAAVYGLFLLGAYLSIAAGVALRFLPPLALLGLLTIPFSVAAARGAWKYRSNIRRLTPFMGMNVLINLLTPVLLAVGLFLSR